MTPAARGTQKFCPNCGAKATKTQKFCRECGTDLLGTADSTEELTAPAPETAARAKSSAARTQAMPPPAPKAPPPPPPPRPSTEDGLEWPAWLAAGAAGVLVIATGLQWFGGFFSVDSYDIPLAALFSDSATGGIPIGVVFVLAGATGLAMALIKPESRTLGITFLSAGAASTFFMLWYMVRILSQAQGAPFFDAFSIGAVLALFSSIAMLVGGVMLLRAPKPQVAQ